MANGMLTLEELKAEVKAGTIDTVVAAMVDMQGRLIGKRFHAQFFVDGGYEETHGCNYLLGVDIAMEPVPGYKATSWQKGYGDFVIKPDMATLRRTPMAAGHRSGAVRYPGSPHPCRRSPFPARHFEKTVEAPRSDEDEGLHGLRA